MSDGSDRYLYIVLGVTAAVVLALIWVVGALAGVLFGSGSAAIGAGETVGVALRLPSHLGDPRLAWPTPARGRLPGAAGFYATLTLLITALGALGLAAAPRLRGMKLPRFWRVRPRAPAADWAQERDLAPLRVKGAAAGRLILGRSRGKLLAAEPRQSVIVFGPTQTHKTSGLVIPALLEWKGPVVCTSVKSDVLNETQKCREGLGKVWIFDPAQVVDAARAKASPLRGAGTWAGALRVAHWLAESAKGSAGDLRDADFWFSNAQKLIAPLLYVAARIDGSMTTVVTWLDEGPELCERAVLAEIEELEAREKPSGEDETGEAVETETTPRKTEREIELEVVKRAFMATQSREERQRSSVYTTAETILAAFADPRVAEATNGSTYTPEALLAGPNTLYLISPNREQERLRTVFSTLIQELLALVEERATRTGQAISPPLLLLLDECANIAPFPGLDETASTAAGIGVQLMTVFQDVAQMEARFGRRAKTIANNHRAIVITNGVSDGATLSLVSQLIGSGEFEQRSVSTSSGERSRRSLTEGDTYRELAPAHFVRQRQSATAIVIYGNLPAAMIDLRVWFADPALRDLHDGKPAENGSEKAVGLRAARR
jgi:type IV secretion system protein VirD4